MAHNYLDYFIATGVPDQGDCYTISQATDQLNITFTLAAFCDYRGNKPLSRKNQTLSMKEHAETLYQCVTNENMNAYCIAKSDSNFQEFEKEMRTFREALGTYWFIIYENRDVKSKGQAQPLAAPPSSCHVKNRITPPTGEGWHHAVAIPKFDKMEEAKKDWFNTSRIQRSKLAIVGEHIYYCSEKEGAPEKRCRLSDIDENLFHDLEKFLYIVMKLDAYKAICDSVANNEVQFIARLNTICKNKGCHFEEDDLRNFHTALKSGYLTILSGMSGTGKSAIVNAYADALGEESCKLLSIPVNPAWTSEYDLLGYYDTRDQKYIPSPSTGLVNFLLEAAKDENQDRLYLICLDEMNLARVEHYFSSFLSVLEREDESKRKIVLYSDKKETSASASTTTVPATTAEPEIPSSIKIGCNVRFVGTVNIDDTTYNFADKVRDRANIINLTICNYSCLSFKKTKSGKKASSTQKSVPFKTYIKTYNSLTDHQEKMLLETLWELHEKLQLHSPNFGISPRTVCAIGTYLANYPNVFIAKGRYNEVLDLQINQRVLTKLHGPEQILKNVLDCLQEHVESQNWTTCNDTIAAKKEELKNYGYCT